MTEKDQNDNSCGPCPEGQIRVDGKCVMPEVTFTTFVMSMNTSALYHLGEIDDPASGKTTVDLVLAKHAIDTLKLLQEKTKGNLTEKENSLLDNVLCDLRLRYVKASQ